MTCLRPGARRSRCPATWGHSGAVLPTKTLAIQCLGSQVPGADRQWSVDVRSGLERGQRSNGPTSPRRPDERGEQVEPMAFTSHSTGTCGLALCPQKRNATPERDGSGVLLPFNDLDKDLIFAGRAKPSFGATGACIGHGQAAVRPQGDHRETARQHVVRRCVSSLGQMRGATLG